MKIESVCVCCGSSPGLLPEYLEAASKFGRLLASRGITLVYGGGKVGLMGAVADGALEAGGRVIGVIPKSLIDKKVAHTGLTELHPVSSMHERKAKMADLSDAFVALPGGVGTLEEIFEACTWTQLGFHSKPCAFLNVMGFYDSLFAFIHNLVAQRFLKPEHLSSLLLETDMDRLLARLQAYEHVSVDKWIDR
ncbi:MAG: TIGR00730 family Rossman fold protein [Verrucomicrobiota bacterium]|jgi:uncharacterized protein (TIGR00730 family)